VRHDRFTHGLLHRPHDSLDLAEKLATLLRDAELRKRLGQQGRQAVFEKFSSETMSSGTLDVMRQLTQKSQMSRKIPC
jgi:glycosyltransferase involved in cell wall biosynthesis